MKQVTPNLESLPERTYIRIGKTIQCFRVLKYFTDIRKPMIIASEPIWQLDLPLIESAIELMEDLYYGEYTGG